MLCVAPLSCSNKAYWLSVFCSVSLYVAQKREVSLDRTWKQIDCLSLPEIERRWFNISLLLKSHQVFSNRLENRYNEFIPGFCLTYRQFTWFIFIQANQACFCHILFQHAFTIHISSGYVPPPPESTSSFTIWNYALSIDYCLVLTTQCYTSSVQSTSLHGAKYLHVHRERVLRLFSKFVSSEINATLETSFICINICTAVVAILECHFLVVLNSSLVHGQSASQYCSLFDFWQWMVSIFIFQWYLEWEDQIS